MQKKFENMYSNSFTKEIIILLFVQQKRKHDQVAFLSSGVRVNAFFWCRLTEWFWNRWRGSIV